MTQRIIHQLSLLGFCALLGLSACGSEPRAARTGDGTPGHPSSATVGQIDGENIGSVELALRVGGAQLDSMNYTIVGSGFATSGSLDVSHSSKASAIVGGIPFGTDYALTVTGKGVSSAPLDCSGSASFNLTSVGPVPVTIPINCKEPDVAAVPAPVPPFTVWALACAFAALGVAARRRTAQG